MQKNSIQRVTNIMAKQDSKKEKWTNEEIRTLFEAYKEECCLYAVNSSNYHNKHLRSEALKRVGDAVRLLKPNVTDKDCASKFHTLRSQYNFENTKVKASKKSGTGTDNVYKPNLWYYEHLMFLDTFFTPRKSRNSLDKNKNNETEENPIFSQDYVFSQDSICTVITDGISKDGHLNVYTEEVFDNESDKAISSDSSAIGIPPVFRNTSINTIGASFSLQPLTCSSRISPGSVRPSSASPAMSSSSEVTECSSSIRSKVQKKRNTTISDNVYAEALQSLADSLRQPIAIPKSPTDTVDGFLMFLGSMLRNLNNENLQLDVMNACIQTCINARTEDLQ